MLTRFRAEPSYNSSALPNFVLDSDGTWVAYQDALHAIATARAEALREVADRAVDYCKQFEGFFDGEDDIGLRSAILAEKQEPQS